MIYKCLPQKVSRIWGSLPPKAVSEEPVGEIWWFFDETILVDNLGNTVVAHDFFDKNSFPLIVKTLHTARDLSVQVHPGMNRQAPLKDESWIVLEGDGFIRHGVKDGTTQIQFKEAVESGLVEDLLLEFKGKADEIIDLPAGTIHSLGKGLTVLEVQVNCTITYRLWDYNRRGLDGKLRELHIEDGLESINWENLGRAEIADGLALKTEFYCITRKEAGSIQMKPFEIVFDPGKSLCFFADSSGGSYESNNHFWLIGIKK